LIVCFSWFISSCCFVLWRGSSAFVLVGPIATLRKVLKGDSVVTFAAQADYFLPLR
jgi:hypothetical protein